MSGISQRDVYRLINEAASRSERVVVATVAHTRGSTPQQRGAKMLFFQNGEVAGTVGGGCIEAEVWAEAQGSHAHRRIQIAPLLAYCRRGKRRRNGLRRYDGYIC